MDDSNPYSEGAGGYSGEGPFMSGTPSAGGSGAGMAASGMSLASVGLTATSDVLKGEGTASADEYKAEQLDRAAQYGDLQSQQYGAQATRNLTMTLGNMDAVRAAARGDPTSPTGAAVRDFVEATGTQQKTIKVDSILAQSQEDESNAAYLRQASSSALLSGDVSAGADVVKGIAGALPALALA